MSDHCSDFCNCTRLSGRGAPWALPHTVGRIPVGSLDLSSSSSLFWINYIRRRLSFLFDAQQPPESFLERTEEFAEKVLWRRECLHCPSFRRGTLFIVAVSEHFVPNGRLEGTSKQSGLPAPSCTPLPAGGRRRSCVMLPATRAPLLLQTLVFHPADWARARAPSALSKA